MIYLAEKTGKFLPTDIRKKAEVISWLMCQMASAVTCICVMHHIQSLQAHGKHVPGMMTLVDVCRPTIYNAYKTGAIKLGLTAMKQIYLLVWFT